MPATKMKPGTETQQWDTGECNPSCLDHHFAHIHMGFDGEMKFFDNAEHSHLCTCGFKWWHKRSDVHDNESNKAAHKCPKCGHEIYQVHGWQDPEDHVHTHHAAHMSTEHGHEDPPESDAERDARMLEMLFKMFLGPN